MPATRICTATRTGKCFILITNVVVSPFAGNCPIGMWVTRRFSDSHTLTITLSLITTAGGSGIPSSRFSRFKSLNKHSVQRV
jgi:hypothetical protein